MSKFFQPISVMLSVCPMKNVYEEYVELYAIATMHVATDKFVRTGYANKAVEMIPLAMMFKLVLMVNAKVKFKSY